MEPDLRPQNVSRTSAELKRHPPGGWGGWGSRKVAVCKGFIDDYGPGRSLVVVHVQYRAFLSGIRRIRKKSALTSTNPASGLRFGGGAGFPKMEKEYLAEPRRGRPLITAVDSTPGNAETFASNC